MRNDNIRPISIPSGDAITGTSSSVGFNCYSRFLVRGTDNTGRGSPLGLETFLRSVNSYIIIISSGSVVGIRIRSGRPNGIVRTTLGCNRLVGVGVSGVHCRREGTGRNITGNRTPIVPGTRPIGGCNFITIYTNRKLRRLFGSVNTSIIMDNKRAVGPSASSVLGTIVTAPTGAIFILPGGGGVVVTTRRSVGLTRNERIHILRAGAVPRNVSTVLVFSRATSTGRGRVTVVRTTRGIRATRMAFTTESDRVRNMPVGRNRVVNLYGNGVGCANGSVGSVTCGSTIGIFGGGRDDVVAIVCKTSAARTSTRRIGGELTRGCNSSIRVDVMGNNRPVCCFVVSIRWCRKCGVPWKYK